MRPKLSTAVHAAGLVTALHGLFVLTGWAVGWPLFLNPPDNFIPMAPATGLAFVALGSAVIVLGLEVAPASAKAIAEGIAWAMSAYAVLNLAVPARVDGLLGGNTGQFGSVRLGVISPITATCLALIAVSAALVRRRPKVAGPLAIVPVIIGFTVTIGYSYGTPLLYASSTIPVALPTALSLMVLGGGVIGLAGLQAWPLKPLVGTSTRARMFRAFLPVTAFLITALGFIDARFGGQLGSDRVLVTGWVSIAGLLLVTLLVDRISRHIGRELDGAAAERLRAEQRYRQIFHQTMAGVATVTRSGRIMLCNDAFARIFGFESAEAAIGTSTPDLYWEAADRERVMLSLKESGQLRNLELRMKRRDGTPVWILANLVVHEAPDGESYIEDTIVDVSDRKTLEQQLWQAQKLDALGSLAGGVAHDFNNLLTAIVGYADLMKMDLAPEDPHRSDVEEIEKACRRAAGLTRQLLTFSRRQPFEPRALKLDASVRDMEKMLTRLLGPQVPLMTAGDPEVGAVWADPNQIEQVVLNLAVNSRDAMPQGGTVSIETRNVHFDERYTTNQADIEAGSYVMLAVSDSGTGMEQQTLNRIFEPFFTTKEKGKGTGLGLATVYGVVKQSHGHILVYSELGIGTTFKVYFPVTDVAVTEDVAPAAQGRVGGQETIMVVEDEAPILSLVVTALKKLGYEVLPATDGETAMKVAASHDGTIDLLLSDGVLSGVRVPDLLRKFRQRRPETRILLMSGYSQEAVFQNEIVDESTEFLAKPFTVNQLTTRIREVLDSESRS